MLRDGSSGFSRFFGLRAERINGSGHEPSGVLVLGTPGMDDFDLRTDAGGSMCVCMRNQEFENLNVIRVAAALVSRARVEEERHCIKSVTHDPEGQRRHAAILAFFDAGLIGQSEPCDLDRRNANSPDRFAQHRW